MPTGRNSAQSGQTFLDCKKIFKMTYESTAVLKTVKRWRCNSYGYKSLKKSIILENNTNFIYTFDTFLLLINIKFILINEKKDLLSSTIQK